MIIGTAGHIDHGKTALVLALTGVDTDRLPEEKRRGITIQLGFAPLELDGIGAVSVVDVPGHEAFVRTMLAGAAGIDLALLVVAADEGVMPQTREHLAILGALGIRGGVVALSKADLVDEELRALAAEDVAALLRGSALDGAPVIPVSARTGDGLPQLRAALAAAVRAVPARDEQAPFRLPVDRVFTVKGTGTVVTGTVWSGTVRRDDTLVALPGGELRVRGIEVHNHASEVGRAGQRVALALAGADREALERGAVLVQARDPWSARDRLRADVALFDDADVILTARTRVRLHLGTADVGARVVARGGPVRPGSRVSVRLVLDQPIAARGGDRFVLRSASPVATIGGGVITDPQPPFRRTPPFAAAGADAAQRLRWMALEEAAHGVSLRALPLRLGVNADALDRLLQANADLVRCGDLIATVATLERARQTLLTAVDQGHASRPLDRGVPLQPIKARLGVSADLADAVVQQTVADGVLMLDGPLAARAGWAPQLTDADRAALASIELILGRAGREGPTLAEITAAVGPRAPALVRLMEREGSVVGIGEQRFITTAAWRECLSALRAGTLERREYAAGELREIFGIPRKFAIPLLEACDRIGVSSRQGDGRRFFWDRPNPALSAFLDSDQESP